MSEKNYDSKAKDAQADENAQVENQSEQAEAFQTYPSVPDDDDPGPPTGGG